MKVLMLGDWPINVIRTESHALPYLKVPGIILHLAAELSNKGGKENNCAASGTEGFQTCCFPLHWVKHSSFPILEIITV